MPNRQYFNVTVTLGASESERLDKLADSQGLTRSGYLRTMINDLWRASGLDLPEEASPPAVKPAARKSATRTTRRRKTS